MRKSSSISISKSFPLNKKMGTVHKYPISLSVLQVAFYLYVLFVVTAAKREIPQRNSEFDKSTHSDDVSSNDIKF